MIDYRIIFIESLSICAAFLAALFIWHMNYSRGKIAKSLTVVYALTFGTCVLDIVWILLHGDPDAIPLHYAVISVYLATFPFVGYSWLLYCVDASPFEKLKRIWSKLLMAIPAVAEAAIIFISIKTGTAYSINEEGYYVRGPLFFIQATIHVYFIAAAVISLVARKHTYFASKKHKYIILSFAVLPTFILGIVQLLLPPGALTTLQYAIFFSLLLVFINSQNGKITRDPLTKLENRYSLDNHIDSRIIRARKSSASFAVILADLDDFKRINDTYGHMEGDVLLRRMGKILSHAAETHDAYAARMSGDEFVLVVDSADDRKTAELCFDVDRAIEDDTLCREYGVTISFGVATYAANDNITDVLRRADEALYEVKERKHAERNN